MSYLCRIMADSVTVSRKKLWDSYAWHQTLWDAFPGKPAGVRTFLSRVDVRGESSMAYLLSPERPVQPDWGVWEVKEIAPSFLGHSRYRFELRANPTIKRIVQDESGMQKKNGKRTAILDRNDLESWLGRKAAASGFNPERIDIDPPILQPFRKQNTRGQHIRVDFRGILTVTDGEAFAAAFHKGIGSAKAFGFGMLLLDPIRD